MAFEGSVVYPGGREVAAPVDSVDDAFISRMGEFVQKMVSTVPAGRMPSFSECSWCDIISADCPDRMDSDEAKAFHETMPAMRRRSIPSLEFKLVERNVVGSRGLTRLCDGKPASDADVSTLDNFALRDARASRRSLRNARTTLRSA